MDPSEADCTSVPRYTRAQEEDRLWRLASAHGIGRRRFLQLVAAGRAAAVLEACAGGPPPTSNFTATPGPGTMASAAWFKDPDPFIKHEDSLEARLENIQGLITPNRFFFVRNNSGSVAVNATGWKLSIEGDAVSSPLELSYDKILNMPSRIVVSYVECAGNQRAMFDLVKGQETIGTQWGRGGVGNAEWIGVPLRDVLREAGIKEEARSVLFVGMDVDAPEEGYRRALPVDKAMHPDTLLAYGMNGEALPQDHGFPLRAIVPGWAGTSSIKWLGQIVVSSERIWTRNNTTHYVLIGEEYEPEGQAEGEVITTQIVKSALALPWPAEMSTGPRQMYGYAHSGFGPIVKVEWSEDSGRSWKDAEITGPQVQYSWARFEFTWEAAPGRHTIMTRATDSAGNTQPDETPYNYRGYLFNQPIPHPIRVT